MTFTRIVLKPQATWANVKSLGYTQHTLNNWKSYHYSPVLLDEPHTNRWKLVNGDCDVVFAQDPLREVRYFHLTGTDRASPEALIRSRMPTFDAVEIETLMASARTPAERVAAVYVAAASAAPQADAAVLDFVTRCLADPHPAVRRAAVDASLVALWPDLRGPLERVATEDPVADHRAFAEDTLKVLREQVWDAAPGAFGFLPLPPDRRRIIPLTGVRDDWHQAAFGKRPEVPTRPLDLSRPEEKAMTFTRVVLKPHVTWSDFRMHGRHPSRWGRAVFVSPLKSNEPYVNRWKSIDGSCTITYFQDPVREIRFYHLMGTDPDSHAELVRSRLATFSRAEVEGVMTADRQTVAEKVTAIYLAAATASAEQDPTVLEYLIRSLADADRTVRRAAVDAALVAFWPELRQPLELVATSDADAGLRAFAGGTVETLRSRVWDAAPGAFDFVPLPADRSRIVPLSGVGDSWHEAAHGRRPEPPTPVLQLSDVSSESVAMTFTRIVLKPEATWKQIKEVQNTERWEDKESSRFFVDTPHTPRWKGVDDGCDIAYFQDPLREVRLFHLTGNDVTPHAALIRDGLPTYEPAEIRDLAAAAQTPAEKITGLYLTAAAATPVPDPTALDCIGRGLTDPDPTVRQAAVDAVLVAPWRELESALERFAETDTDAELRAFAAETLTALRAAPWAVETSEFVPLPPDRDRIPPRSTTGEQWYAMAFPNRPLTRAPGATRPLPSRKPEFHPPEWLIELAKAGDRDGVQWHTADQVRTAASQFTEFRKPNGMALSDSTLARNRSLWESMVPVADGPEFTDRVGRTERSRLFVNRDDPHALLLALAADHPPILWVPAGRTPDGVAAAVAAYLFPGIPPQADLPFQGRLFLSTQAMSGGFEDVERGVTASPFTDMLPWGSSHPADPYPDRVPLGRVPVGELRRYIAQAPDELPRTSLRTRYSRSVVQLLDWRNGYFADLYFRPAPPADWAAGYNAECGTDFPPGTPIDVAAALSGLACIGPERIRPQMDEADDEYQRNGMREIIEFLEQAPAVPAEA